MSVLWDVTSALLRVCALLKSEMCCKTAHFTSFKTDLESFC